MPDAYCDYVWTNGKRCTFAAGHHGIHSLYGTPIVEGQGDQPRIVTIDPSVYALPMDAGLFGALGYLAIWGNAHYRYVSVHAATYLECIELRASYDDGKYQMSGIKRTPTSEWEFHS